MPSTSCLFRNRICRTRRYPLAWCYLTACRWERSALRPMSVTSRLRSHDRDLIATWCAPIVRCCPALRDQGIAISPIVSPTVPRSASVSCSSAAAGRLASPLAAPQRSAALALLLGSRDSRWLWLPPRTQRLLVSGRPLPASPSCTCKRHMAGCPLACPAPSYIRAAAVVRSAHSECVFFPRARLLPTDPESR